jgi:hydrogenase maturation protease
MATGPSHSTIVVGVGNPLLGDDGAGVAVARRLQSRLHARLHLQLPGWAATADRGVRVRECPAGGLRLAELLVGHASAILVDACAPGDDPPGTVRELGLAGCTATWHQSCAHDTNLPLAIATLAGLGEPMPAQLRIIGIAAGRVDTFTEELSPPVARAVERVVDELLRALCGECGAPSAGGGTA